MRSVCRGVALVEEISNEPSPLTKYKMFMAKPNLLLAAETSIFIRCILVYLG